MKKFWLNYQTGRNYVKEEIAPKHPFFTACFLIFRKECLI
jgi:hypothetical protein